MKYALQTLPSGETRMVDASGNPLGCSDVDRPILHILPKLWVPAEILGRPGLRFDDGLMCEEVTLTVSSSLPVDVLPEGGVKVRQPYPNRRYFVGGSELIRNGWIVRSARFSSATHGPDVLLTSSRASWHGCSVTVDHTRPYLEVSLKAVRAAYEIAL